MESTPTHPIRGYRDYVRLGTYTALKEEAHKRLDGFGSYTFVEAFSPDAANMFADGSLDFVYLDGNHSEPYITQDIRSLDAQSPFRRDCCRTRLRAH
jgi:hypothetical protein